MRNNKHIMDASQLMAQMLIMTVRAEVNKQISNDDEPFVVRVAGNIDESGSSSLDFDSDEARAMMMQMKKEDPVLDITTRARENWLYVIAYGKRNDFVIDGTIFHGELAIMCQFDHGSSSARVTSIPEANIAKLEELTAMRAASEDKLKEEAESITSDLIKRMKGERKP